MSKLDDQFAKKVETDTLTKAISKLGFNADIFMGKFDDQRYVEEMKEEFKEPVKAKKLTLNEEQFNRLLESNDLKLLNSAFDKYSLTTAQTGELNEVVEHKTN
jgi:hypothetical protein